MLLPVSLWLRKKMSGSGRCLQAVRLRVFLDSGPVLLMLCDLTQRGPTTFIIMPYILRIGDWDNQLLRQICLESSLSPEETGLVGFSQVP